MRKIWILGTVILFSFQLWGAPGSELVGFDFLTNQRQEFSLTDTEYTLILFLSSKCPCSDSHNKELIQLREDYPKVQFLGFNSNLEEDPAQSRQYFEKQNYGFPILRDKDQLMAKKWNAFKTPHAFLINKKGVVVFQGGVTSTQHFDGKADRLYLREALEDIKLGRSIRTAEARTLGCAIVRR